MFLLKTLPWLFVWFTVKSNVLRMTYKILHALVSSPLPLDLNSYHSSPWLLSSSHMASLLFLRHTKTTPSVALLFPLTRMFFHWGAGYSLASLRSLCKWHLTSDISLSILFKNWDSLHASIPLYPALFFFIGLLIFWYVNICLLVHCLFPPLECKLRDCKDFILSLLYLQCPTQWLTHNRCLISISHINK